MKRLLSATLFLPLFFLSGCSLNKLAPENIENEIPNNLNPIACTAEAKLCSDGSAVGRTGPNCEFAPCPGEGINKEIIILKIYFGNSNLNPNAENCAQVYPRERTIPAASSTPQLALQELFKGPTEIEKSQGYFSFFSGATQDILKGIKIENGMAYVDLKDVRQIIPNASASCGSAEFLAELETTLKQFPTIKKIIFALDGKPAAFYEWLQIGCPTENNFCDEAQFNF